MTTYHGSGRVGCIHPFFSPASEDPPSSSCFSFPDVQGFNETRLTYTMGIVVSGGPSPSFSLVFPWLTSGITFERGLRERGSERVSGWESERVREWKNMSLRKWKMSGKKRVLESNNELGKAKKWGEYYKWSLRKLFLQPIILDI